jgi:NACHT domain
MNPIGSALVAAAAKDATGPIATVMKNLGVDAYNKLTSHFQRCFQGHVEATFARCSKMKNILYRDQSVDFISQYVNIIFSSSKKKIADRTALFRIRRGGRFLICGTAGAGKTMFMRWSALELINSITTHGRIPLYLEMRYFEDAFENESLDAYLHQKTSSVHDAASFGQFVQGLQSGMFIILLDAIDEIKPNLREKVVIKILNFLRQYPLCGITISSRFDDKLGSIQEFSGSSLFGVGSNVVTRVAASRVCQPADRPWP